MKYVHWLPKRSEYVVRIIVPPELRGIIGQRELGGRLGADKRIAEKNAHSIIARDLARIEEASERLKAMQPTLSTAAKAHFRAELETDTTERLSSEDVLIDLRQATQPRRASLLRLVAAGQIVGEEADALIGYAADALQTKGIAPDVPRATLLKALAEVQLDAMAQIEARDKGMLITPGPKSALLIQPDPEPVTPAPEDRGGGTTLSQILEAFHRERTAGAQTLAQKTMEEHKSAVRMLEEFLGGSVPVRSITRIDMLGYKAALLQTPSRYTLRFRGLTLPQAIRANQKLEEPFATLDPQTINMKWLSHISTICKWAMNNGYLDANPASGVRVDEGKGYKEPSRVPFSQDDLARIFGSPLYKDTPSKKWGTKQWALLVALYTGARSQSEIARIRLDDVYQEQGVDVIHLVLASKNVRSKRLVPIHSDLINYGFLEHVERLRRKGATRVTCYGFGGHEAPERLRRAYTQFYAIELLASHLANSEEAPSRTALLRPSLASRLLKRIVISLEDHTGWAAIEDVKIELAERHGGLDARACGYKSLSALLSDLSTFEVDLGAKRGARVRRKPSRRAIRRKARREEEAMSRNQREGIKQREPME